MKAAAILWMLVPSLALAQATTPETVPGPGTNITYGYAQVLRATPAYVSIRTRTPEQRCESQVVRDNRVVNGSRCRTVQIERVERRITGYDVEYVYKGEKFMSRLAFDPGNRLRVRVSVTPDDQGAGVR